MRRRAREGLLAACADPRLIGLNLWPTQRRLLRDVERGSRVNVWALGRRSGKSTAAAVALIWDALLRPELDRLVRPGERRFSVAIGTNIRQSRLVIAAVRSIIERSPVLRPLIASQTDDEIAFTSGATIAAFPCTSRGGRGWPISCLVMDEAAHFVDTEGNSAAEQVWRALVPSTAQFGKHGRVVVSSTPYGADGLFASLWAQADSGELLDAVAHQATTAEANPTIEPGFLVSEQARDPDSFRSEYLAQFVGGGYGYLDPERIAEAVTLPGELDPGHASGWIAGLDPAFSSDPFGLALVGRDLEHPQRLVLGPARAWRPAKRKAVAFEERRETEDAILAEVAEVCLRYRASVVTDQYAAAPIVDYLRRRGLTVRTHPMSAASKSAVFASLRARLNAGSLDLYEHSDLLAELRRLRTRYSAGAASVVNPRVGGSHGDLAQSLALACFEHGTGGPVALRGESVAGRRIGERDQVDQVAVALGLTVTQAPEGWEPGRGLRPGQTKGGRR